MAGRPRGRTTIVPVDSLVPLNIIESERWSIKTLSPLFGSKLLTIEWLAQRKLLRNSLLCLHCICDCTLNTYKQGIDEVSDNL